MKITVVGSTPERLDALRQAVESGLGEHHHDYLLRQGGRIPVGNIDLAATNIVLVDSEQVLPEDLEAIAALLRDYAGLYFFYASDSFSEASIVQLMQSGVSEVLREPLDPQALRAAVERVRARRSNIEAARSHGQVLAFISCKGGAGATFVASNLGYVLGAEMDKRVLFIDLHMQYGDAAFYLMDKPSGATLSDVVQRRSIDTIAIASALAPIEKNYFLLQAPESKEKALAVTAKHIDTLLSVAVQDYDYVIVDLPHDIEPVTIKALDRAHGIYIVMQPIIPYVRAVANMLQLLTQLDYDAPKVHVLLNRADNNALASVQKIESSLQKKVFQSIPNDYQSAFDAVNLGVPIAKLAPASPVSQALRELAQKLTGSDVPHPRRSWLKNLLR